MLQKVNIIATVHGHEMKCIILWGGFGRWILQGQELGGIRLQITEFDNLVYPNIHGGDDFISQKPFLGKKTDSIEQPLHWTRTYISHKMTYKWHKMSEHK